MVEFQLWCVRCLVLMAAAAAGVASPPAFADEGASRETSPRVGDIAMMVRRGGESQIIETWRRELREGSPQVRAAVARVAHADRATALVDDLRTALQSETDYQAAVEEAAALASMGGAEQDALLLEAGKRLGDRALAEVGLLLAQARRAQAIPAYLEKVRRALDAYSTLGEFLRLATLTDRSGLAASASAALESADAGLWLAALDTSLELDAPLQTSLLASALRHASATISIETAWRLALVYAEKPQSRAIELLSSLATSTESQDVVKTNADFAMGTELLARILGRKPVESRSWIEYLQGSGRSRMDGFPVMSSLVQYLTSGERKALKKRLERLFPSIELPDLRRPKRAGDEVPAEAAARPMIVRMANGFPKGYVSEAVDVSGCSLDAGPVLGEAELSYDDLGRPVKVSLLRSPSSPGCVEVMTALFASTIKPLNDYSDAGRPQNLFLVLEKGYLSRLEAAAAQDREAVFLQPDDSAATSVRPPNRTHFIKPGYPDSARAHRKVGKVILEVIVDREGLISDIRLLKQTDDEFVAPTFASVAQWRYQPALIGGRPARVYLTVIVDFSLK